MDCCKAPFIPGVKHNPRLSESDRRGLLLDTWGPRFLWPTVICFPANALCFPGTREPFLGVTTANVLCVTTANVLCCNNHWCNNRIGVTTANALCFPATHWGGRNHEYVTAQVTVGCHPVPPTATRLNLISLGWAHPRICDCASYCGLPPGSTHSHPAQPNFIGVDATTNM